MVNSVNVITSCSRTIPGCIVYASNSFLCQTCNTSLTLSSDGTACNSAVAGCSIPSSANPSLCAQCVSGSYLSPYDATTDASNTCTAMSSPVTVTGTNGNCLGVDANK